MQESIKPSGENRNSVDLISPCGGRLIDLRAKPEELESLKARAGNLPSVQLSERATCDMELLATGAFSPLDRFMGAADYTRVLEEMRLSNGLLFPIPITLPVATDAPLQLDAEIALRSPKNDLLAIMTVEEIYQWDVDAASDLVFGTRDVRHPLILEMRRW